MYQTLKDKYVSTLKTLEFWDVEMETCTMESSLPRFRSSSSSWLGLRLVALITASPKTQDPIKQRLVKPKKKPLDCLLLITIHRHVPLFSHKNDILPLLHPHFKIFNSSQQPFPNSPKGTCNSHNPQCITSILHHSWSQQQNPNLTPCEKYL